MVILNPFVDNASVCAQMLMQTVQKLVLVVLATNLFLLLPQQMTKKLMLHRFFFNILFLNGARLFHIVIQYNLYSKNPIIGRLLLRKYFSGSDITKILLVARRPVHLHGMVASVEQLINFFDSEISIIMRQLFLVFHFI